MAQREDDLSHYFKFELTTMSPSLFKCGLMRKSQKVQLRHYLVEKIDQEEPSGISIIDGGYLLHKVR